MHNFYRTISGMAAVAVLGAFVTMGTAQHALAQAQGGTPAGQSEKKVKDQAEYDIYNEVLKDINGANWAKAVTDLDTWKSKYPESDYKDDRLYYYIQAYNGTKQPAKVLEIASQLLQQPLANTFKDPKQGPQQIVAVLYLSSVAVQSVQGPTAEQLATGQKAAQELLAYTPTFFSADRKPAGTSDADWTKARTDLETVAKGAVTYAAMAPGITAMQKKDFETAIAAYTKALEANPDSAQISYALGSALISSRKPENVSKAIYQVARAASLDPAKGGIADPKARTEIEAYLKKIYTNIHGSDEGLDQVKQLAAAAPLAPADFHVKTLAEITAEQEEKFAKDNPQLALWLNIKRQLAEANGEQYFASSMKDAEVPKLRGVIVEGKPACKSTTLGVAIREPGATGEPTSEITLKLETPLAGKPIPGTEVQFTAVPSAFSKEPFMLTMDAENAKIEGLKEEKCVAPPAKKAAPKKK